MVLDSKDVGVSLGTLAPAAMDVVLDGAADAGFGSIAIWQPHIDAARAAGMSLQDLRAALDQRGLSIVCWESMFSWLGDDATAKANETALALQACDALAPTTIGSVYLDAEPVSLEKSAEAYAAMCAPFESHDVVVGLEPIAWSGISSIREAVDIVRTSGVPNGGIILDFWQWYRAGADEQALSELEPGDVALIQICDAADESPANLLDDTLKNRRLPGQGVADVAKRLRALLDRGIEAPIVLEVFNDDFFAVSPRDACSAMASSLADLQV
jgi:sugar phosphate isomerase/epimerase